MSHHYTTADLVGYARGIVTASEGEELVAHCRACETCGNRLAAVLALRGAVHVRHARIVRRRWLAAAAAIATIGLVAFAVQALGPYGPAALATSDPLPREATRFPLDELLPISNTDTGARLLAAVDMIADRDYEQAVEVLDQLHRDEPSSRIFSAYDGIARYLSGDDSREVGRLLATGVLEQDDSVSSFAHWYFCNYLLRTHQLDDAVERLSDLATLDELPGRLAKQLLADLEPYTR